MCHVTFTMALLAHSPCQAQGLQKYILEADESGLTAALTKLKGMLADEDLAVGIDPDPLSLLAHGDLLRRQSCAMTVK